MLGALLLFCCGTTVAKGGYTTWTVCASGCDHTTIKACLSDPTFASGDKVHVSAETILEPNAIDNSTLTNVEIYGEGIDQTYISLNAMGVGWYIRGDGITIRDMTINVVSGYIRAYNCTQATILDAKLKGFPGVSYIIDNESADQDSLTLVDCEVVIGTTTVKYVNLDSGHLHCNGCTFTDVYVQSAGGTACIVDGTHLATTAVANINLFNRVSTGQIDLYNCLVDGDPGRAGHNGIVGYSDDADGLDRVVNCVFSDLQYGIFVYDNGEDAPTDPVTFTDFYYYGNTFENIGMYPIYMGGCSGEIAYNHFDMTGDNVSASAHTILLGIEAMQASYTVGRYNSVHHNTLIGVEDEPYGIVVKALGNYIFQNYFRDLSPGILFKGAEDTYAVKNWIELCDYAFRWADQGTDPPTSGWVKNNFIGRNGTAFKFDEVDIDDGDWYINHNALVENTNLWYDGDSNEDLTAWRTRGYGNLSQDNPSEAFLLFGGDSTFVVSAGAGNGLWSVGNKQYNGDATIGKTLWNGGLN